MNDFKIYPILLLLFLNHAAAAQFSAGVKMDFVSNNVQATSGTVNLDNLLQSKTGFKLGATAGYDFSDNFSLETGVTYNSLGFLISQNTGVDLFGLNIPLGATLDTEVNYLEIPLLAKFKRSFGWVTGYIEAGPSLNYAMNGNIKTTANSFLDFTLIDRDIDLQNNSFNRTNLSGNVGIGVSQYLSEDLVISASLRYTRDFTSSVEIPIVNTQIKNQSIGLGINLAKHF